MSDPSRSPQESGGDEFHPDVFAFVSLLGFAFMFVVLTTGDLSTVAALAGSGLVTFLGMELSLIVAVITK